MKNNNRQYPSLELTATARGEIAADVVIKNGKLVNVNTGEIEKRKDIALKGKRIALVGEADHTIGSYTEVVDARGGYLTPGFMDGHIHVESSMVTLTEYSKAVIPQGTTAIFMDPHEIANVMGMDGVELMIEEGRDVPLRVFTTVPSCVPAAPGFEDNGAEITEEDIKEALKKKEIIGLGEMMNYPGVLNGEEEVHN
ncbi:MAG: amidohydrolase family protein, partial [Halanaerobiaceae bacterium]